MTEEKRTQPKYQRGDRIGNRYKVHSFEQGGMGVVYFCVDTEIDRPIALKTPIVAPETPPERRASQQRRFLREARTWAALGRHPNIVRCHYLDRIDGQAFLFLDWIADPNRRHTSLYHLIKQGGMGLDLALEITLDIAYGLRYAGEARPGLVHRDLKPGNVLIDQTMTAKVSDFGLATAWLPQHGEANRDRKIVGTPLYRPPEIWMGAPTDARSDIYACGLILYEMLTGETAVTGKTPQEIEAAHITGDTSHLPEAFPAEVDAIVQRSTRRPMDERYASFDALIEALGMAIRQFAGREPKPAPVAGVVTAGDLVNSGNTFAWLNRHKDSLAAYNQALEMDAKSATALQNRGALYMMMGDVQPALVDLNASIRINPRVHSAYYNRAVALSASGNPVRALQDYNRTLSLSPGYVSAYYNRGILLRDMGQHEQALIDFTRVVNLTPTASDAYHNRGLTNLELSDYQAALDDFTRALELQPDQVASLYNRGVTNQLLGDVDAAIADYSAAIELNPDLRAAFEMRALLRHEKGEYADALEPGPSLELRRPAPTIHRSYIG